MKSGVYATLLSGRFFSASNNLTKGFPDQLEDRASILVQDLEPGTPTHLRKVDTPKRHSHDEVIDLPAHRFITHRCHGLSVSVRIVGRLPSMLELKLGLSNGHFQRRVRHLIRGKIQP